MKTTRNSCFETNSSSCHSFVIKRNLEEVQGADIKLDYWDSMKTGDELRSLDKKISYLFSDLIHNYCFSVQYSKSFRDYDPNLYKNNSEEGIYKDNLRLIKQVKETDEYKALAELVEKFEPGFNLVYPEEINKSPIIYCISGSTCSGLCVGRLVMREKSKKNILALLSSTSNYIECLWDDGF